MIEMKMEWETKGKGKNKVEKRREGKGKAQEYQEAGDVALRCKKKKKIRFSNPIP